MSILLKQKLNKTTKKTESSPVVITNKTDTGVTKSKNPHKSLKGYDKEVHFSTHIREGGSDSSTPSGSSEELSIELPSWVSDEFNSSTIPPIGTKIAWLDYAHNPIHFIKTYDGNTPIGESVEYIGKCGDKNIFVYVYRG